MFEKEFEDVIDYFFSFMLSKENRKFFLEKNNINVNTNYMSLKKASLFLKENENFLIKYSDIIKFSKDYWKPTNKKLHLNNLKSGLLKGHNWHGSMPSFLHLSLQNKVRECSNGDISINELLEIGKDIMKQEYFIVATHDLCETYIIENIQNVIPPIANKSVSDFIFNDIPYDLKNSLVPNGWTFKEAKNNVEKFAFSLFENGDSARLRKQAENSINNWGVNRFYIILNDVERWLQEPEIVLNEIIIKVKKLKEPIQVKVEDIEFLCQIIFIE